MIAYAVLPMLAALLGFALARSNSCTVEATAQLIEERKLDFLAGLLLAAASAGLVLAALALADPDDPSLPMHFQPGWAPLAGGAVMGLGALVNGRCMLGSITVLGRGNLNYLFTLAGMAAALLATPRIYRLPVAGDGTGMASFGELPPLSVLLATMALVLIIGGSRLWRGERGSTFYLVLAGISGAALFAANPQWSYLAAIDRAVRGEVLGEMAEYDVAAVALFAGATLSAWLRDRFDLAMVAPGQAFACFVGGAAMAVGALIIPGGNDTLLLWTIPGLAGYGLIAYAAMIAVIAVGLVVRRAARRRSSQLTD